MNIFKRQPKVKFLCVGSGVAEIYPPIPTRKTKPQWMYEEAEAFSKRKKADEHPHGNSHGSIAKCQGIKDLYEMGWILRTWQDIHIDVKPDGSFVWTTPTDQERLMGLKAVDVHVGAFDRCPHLRHKIPVFKLQFPYVIMLPKGYNMLQMPVPYGDTSVFYAATGVFNQAFGIMDANVQLFWNKRGPHVIPAGTPIAQLVLVKQMEPKMELRYATPAELKLIQVHRTIKEHKFYAQYSAIKEGIKNSYKYWSEK